MMSLPEFLIDRYKDWKDNSFQNEKKLYEEAEINGQKPKALIISCCDSRVDGNLIFRGKIGEFFIHRNIANLVPSYNSVKKK